MEQSEVDKAQDTSVELDKDRHKPHVDLSGLRKAKVVRDDPCHGLAFDLCLEVVTLDAAEHLPQCLGLDDVVHELGGQPLAQGGHLHRGLLGLGEGGVEETKAEAVLQVSDGI